MRRRLFDVEAERLAVFAQAGPLARPPVCHSYRNGCGCPPCGDRQRGIGNGTLAYYQQGECPPDDEGMLYRRAIPVVFPWEQAA